MIDDEKKMKEIESKRKGKKAESATDVPYPEGVRRNKVQIVDMLPAMDELEEDKKLISTGLSV